ncbi:hypothetical protein FQA47_006392 [Oryzias melastigma]|uniref:Uncharacterized protein n=1 Tax=Oryzias melastigma TaxID=30732 RepID=A0A834CGC3_ORYME|nr:hypothetical protein FQA47_006392 [Oryzias melastigma]
MFGINGKRRKLMNCLSDWIPSSLPEKNRFLRVVSSQLMFCHSAPRRLDSYRKETFRDRRIYFLMFYSLQQIKNLQRIRQVQTLDIHGKKSFIKVHELSQTCL